MAEVKLAFTPRPYQKAAHALLLTVRFLVLVWHRRAGKTVFVVVELILAALRCKKKRGHFGYICPYLKQSKAVAWNYLKDLARGIPGVVVNDGELAIDFPNGARIRLFGADNPDSLRGLYFDGIVLDEVADMKASIWGEIIRPALADRMGWAIFIGTPKGVNLFSELYYHALKEPDGWAADLKRASETGALPQSEIDDARATMSAPQFAQEFDCDFAAAATNVLITLDIILASQQRSISPADYEDAPKILGVDVARFGDDRTCLFPRQGRAAFVPKVLRGANTMETAGQVAFSIEKWEPDAVFIDITGGLGAGVYDRLLELGHDVMGVEFGGKAIRPKPKCKNRRAEMWWAMGDWIRTGGCLPSDPELAAELTAPTYWFDSSGALVLEPKDDMKARGLPSPDKADALACTFAAPVAKKPPRFPGSPRGGHCLTDFNPYA